MPWDGLGVAQAKALGEFVGFVRGDVQGGLLEGARLSFSQEEMGDGKEDEGFEELPGAGLGQCLVVDDDIDEEGKGYEVTNNRQGQVGDGAFVKVSERDGADGEEQKIGEKERHADGYDELCGQDESRLH